MLGRKTHTKKSCGGGGGMGDRGRELHHMQENLRKGGESNSAGQIDFKGGDPWPLNTSTHNTTMDLILHQSDDILYNGVKL